MTGRVPTRVQHRGGALWILNSAALEIVARALDNSPDVERDSGGVPTGRLWRYDARLAAALPDAGDAQSAALAEVTTTLLGLGITGATDATPVMDDTALELLRATAPLRLHLLGTRDLASARRVLGGRVGVGARKLLLRDHDLPDLATLVAMIDPTSAGSGRAPVAVHCVTRDSAVLVAVALAECGSVPGDRIEHGAVLPPEVADLLATLEGGPPVVVTQPDLLRSRGDSYLESVPRDDQAHLYPWSGLHQHGLKVVASSDAPFGEVDPWQVVRSAAQRRTRAGRTIGASERVGTLEALRGYLTEPEEPAGPPRVVAPGAAADLVLADTDWSGLTADPGAGRVRQTFVASCCAGCTGQR